jgi:hypothetical protein
MTGQGVTFLDALGCEEGNMRVAYLAAAPGWHVQTNPGTLWSLISNWLAILIETGHIWSELMVGVGSQWIPNWHQYPRWSLLRFAEA